MLQTRNGTPSSRTPSPPVIAQRPRQPAPEKRRPIIRARSQTSLTGTRGSPSNSAVTSRTSSPAKSASSAVASGPPSPTEFRSTRSWPMTCRNRGQDQRRSLKVAEVCAMNSADTPAAGMLSTSQSSPCLVIAGMHDHHSKEQQRLIARRDVLSDVFGAFNGAHRGAQKLSPHHSSSPGALRSACPGDSDHHRGSERHSAACAAQLRQLSTPSNVSGRAEKRIERTVSANDIREASRGAGSRDCDSVEENRRKVLDNRLLRALSGLGPAQDAS